MSGDSRPEFAVIGGGIAGLAAAATLAKRGRRVAVLEQSGSLGGSSRFGFGFLGGCGEHGWLRETLVPVGAWERLDVRAADPVFEARFPGHRFTAPADPERCRHELSALWPGEAAGIASCLAKLAAMGSGYLEQVDGPAASGPLSRWHGRTLRDFLATHTRNEELQAALSALWLFAGLPPERLSASHYAMIWHSLYVQGAATVSGGAAAVAKALADTIRELGGTVETGCAVRSVLRRRGKVRGIQLQDGREWLDVTVIATGSPQDLFEELLDQPGETPAGYDPLRSFVTGSSALSVIAEAEGEVALPAPLLLWHDTYDLHEAYMDSQRGEPEFQCIALAQDDADPKRLRLLTLAPYGRYDNWHVPFSRRREPGIEKDAEYAEYAELRDELAAGLADRAAEALGISGGLQTVSVMTPLSIETETWNAGGAIGGWANIPEQAGGNRPGPRTPFQHLYLAGHWVFPGGGIPAEAMSGRIAALTALHDLGS